MGERSEFRQYLGACPEEPLFAKQVRVFVKKLSKTTGNIEDGKQVVKSSGSVGANYIEANESLSRKDFVMRIKICRKESKESMYWLQLVDTGGSVELQKECESLEKEAKELTMTFGSIVRKVE